MKTFCFAALAAATTAAKFDNDHGPDTRKDLKHTEDDHGHTINFGLPDNHGMIAKKAAGAPICSSIKCFHDVHQGGSTCGAGRKFALDTDMGYFQGEECPNMAKPTTSIRVMHQCSGAAQKWGGRDCKETVCNNGHFCAMDGNNGCVCVALDITAPSKVCCKALTANCLACAADQTVGEYCAANPRTFGCPKICCKAFTASCLSCAASQTVEQYCAKKPTTPGCPNPAGKVFLSEYVEGTSYRKAVELYNPTSAKISLKGVQLVWHHNGKDHSGNKKYTVSLNNKSIKAGKTFVICRKETRWGRADVPNSKCDMQISSKSAASLAVLHNGDDAITLEVDGKVTDVIGKVGKRPSKGCWKDTKGKCMTKDKTIRRKKSISTGNTVFTNTEWSITNKNQLNGLGKH